MFWHWSAPMAPSNNNNICVNETFKTYQYYLKESSLCSTHDCGVLFFWRSRMNAIHRIPPSPAQECHSSRPHSEPRIVEEIPHDSAQQSLSPNKLKSPLDFPLHHNLLLNKPNEDIRVENMSADVVLLALATTIPNRDSNDVNHPARPINSAHHIIRACFCVCCCVLLCALCLGETSLG